jgi:hypothetical protein
VMEFWATGHNDSLVVLLVALALLASARHRWTSAFVALSLATAAKIWPAFLFPVFVARKKWQAWVAVPIFGLAAWPYWTNVEENARFLSGFLGGWRNNDSLFGLLLWVTGDLYRAKTAAFAIVCAAVLAVTALKWPLDRAILAVVAVMLMVSANCHPWYLTWFLPLLPLVPVPALLLWTALVPIAYSTVSSWTAVREWHGSTPVRWLEYAPVYALLLGSWLWRWR